MFDERGLLVRFVIFGMMFSVLIMGIVSADTEPNDSSLQAESIGKGTHTGSLTYNDYVDWYKVEGMGDHEVTVTATLMSSGAEESVSVNTVDEYGITDEQIQIYLFGEEKSDYCHWKDNNDRGFMYLKVDGFGDYKLKIEWGGGGGSNFAPNIFCMVCGLGALGVVLIGGISALIYKLMYAK